MYTNSGLRNKNLAIVIAIFIVAAFFRLYNLSSVPVHPSLDEATTGYNAYSILKTGGDEYGYKFPVLLRAYDDWRPALYTYLVIPFVKVLGLNVLAVRLPSALLSILTVISIYFLSMLLIKDRGALFSGFSLSPPIIITFLFAISPWDIYIGRLGHEANAFFAFFMFGVTFFYWFVEKKLYRYLSLSTVFFALSFTAYQNGKIFIPLIVIVLFALYFKKLLVKKFLLFLNVFIGIIIILPILIASFGPNALIRFQATNLFSDVSNLQLQSAKRMIIDKQTNNHIGLILDNRRLIYPKLFLTAYVSHINPTWLAFNGGDEQFKIPNTGLIYPYELFLIPIGASVFFVSKKVDKRVKVFLLFWGIFAVLPGAVTNGFPHAMRTLQLLPFLSILSGIGVYEIINLLKNRNLRAIALGIVGVVFLVSIAAFYTNYFNRFPKLYANQFQYGISKAIDYTQARDPRVLSVYVSNKDRLFESYMFYLFLTQYDPAKYQKEGGSVSGGYDKTHIIGNYHFMPVNDIKNRNVLIISNPNEARGSVEKTIYYPNNKEALWILRQ